MGIIKYVCFAGSSSLATPLPALSQAAIGRTNMNGAGSSPSRPEVHDQGPKQLMTSYCVSSLVAIAMEVGDKAGF